MIEKIKKLLPLIFICALMFILVSCSGGETEGETESTEETENITESISEGTSESESESESETEPPTEAPTFEQYSTLTKENIVFKPAATDDGSTDLKLDIYYPTNRTYEKNPVIVAFFGGGWVAGDKSQIYSVFGTLFDELREKGYMIVTAQYRYVSDTIHFPSNLEDCADSVNFLVNNCQEYDIDINSIGLFGYSAGAHLAMMTAYGADNLLNLNGGSIKYCISLAGPTKLYDEDVEAYPQSTLELLNLLFGGSYEEKPEEYKKGSPYFYIDETKTTPLMMVHGNMDGTVPIGQSRVMFEKFSEFGLKCQFVGIDRIGHGFYNDYQSDVNLESLGEAKSKIINFIQGCP